MFLRSAVMNSIFVVAALALKERFGIIVSELEKRTTSRMYVLFGK